MMPRKNTASGFTLIELLITIAIIGILSAAVLVGINPVQKMAQARDAKRKSDISVIRTALQNYAVMNGGMYPPAGACAYGSNCYVYSTGGSSWIPALVSGGELKTVPVDPINSGGAPWTVGVNGYTYAYGNVTSSGQFDLVARLENTSDLAICGVKDYIMYYGGHWCTAFGGSYSNQIYEMSPKNGD